jgi:hypothetical protein
MILSSVGSVSSQENDGVLRRILSVLLASMKRLSSEDLYDRMKEVLLLFSQTQDNKKLLTKIFHGMDDETKMKLSFLHLV